MQHQDSVTSLRAELFQANGQIKVLEEGNSSLQEQVEQLQEQLKERDGLLRKETKKRRGRFRAYVDVLNQLTEYQAKCETLETRLHHVPAQPETSWSREVEVDQEKQDLKKQVNLLKTGQRTLEDELKKKDELIVTATKRRRIQTNAYLDSLAMLTVKEKEVNKSQAETQEARLWQEMTQTEGVSSSKVEAVEKENETLKEQVHKLKGEHTKLQDEVRHKEELVKKEISKRQASTKSYLASQHKLSDMENELDSVERKWRRKVEQLETVKVEEQDELQVEQLQEQLKVRDELLRKETKKRRARFRAFVDVLNQLTEYQAKCETLETCLHQEPVQPETSWSREAEDLKKQVNLLKTGQRRLEDELKKKDELIVTATKRRRIQTNAYLDSLAMLTVKEKEVNKSQAETQEARLRQEMTQTEGVSSSQMEAVEKENETQVHKLKGEHTKLQDEVRHKEELVKKEFRKRQASTKLYFASELDSVKRKWRSKVEQLETSKMEDQDELLKQETDYPPKKRGMRGRLP